MILGRLSRFSRLLKPALLCGALAAPGLAGTMVSAASACRPGPLEFARDHGRGPERRVVVVSRGRGLSGTADRGRVSFPDCGPMSGLEVGPECGGISSGGCRCWDEEELGRLGLGWRPRAEQGQRRRGPRDAPRAGLRSCSAARPARSVPGLRPACAVRHSRWRGSLATCPLSRPGGWWAQTARHALQPGAPSPSCCM